MDTKAMNDTQEDRRKIEVNDRYQRVVTLFLNLTTGALFLPIFFLRTFAGIKDGDQILPHLSYSAYFAWFLLAISLLCGFIYFYVSVKWVKHALNLPVKCSEKVLQGWLDITFWVQVGSFGLGILSLFWFAIHVK
jgi:hypothetical protein